jgi:hypothetical protein
MGKENKGNPSERMGRKASGLIQRLFADMVAGLPGRI